MGAFIAFFDGFSGKVVHSKGQFASGCYFHIEKRYLCNGVKCRER